MLLNFNACLVIDVLLLFIFFMLEDPDAKCTITVFPDINTRVLIKFAFEINQIIRFSVSILI